MVLNKFFAARPLTPSRASMCLLVNLLLTPGLGSLMGRRWVAGAGQLTLAITGFGLLLAWFVDVLRQYYGMMTSDVEPRFHHWLAFAGAAVFALAWLWALVTSLSLLHEARRNERAGTLGKPAG